MTVYASESRLSTAILGLPSPAAGARPARRRSSSVSTDCSSVSTAASAASVRPHCAAEVTASPVGSLTWKVSMATPSARVAICAEMMLRPWAASVPAMSAKSPGTSWVTTTRSDEPRSG